MAVFYHTPAELSYVVVDRITSITVVAPEYVGLDCNWKVRVTLGSDQIERVFSPRDYTLEAHNAVKAFAMARDDAVVFARELAAHLNALMEQKSS